MINIGFYNIYEELNLNNYMFENQNAPLGDNLLYPLLELKKYAGQRDINVHTLEDTTDLSRLTAFVFIDMPKRDNKFFQHALHHNLPMFLIVMESKIIIKDNFDKKNHGYFKKIFTYYDPIIDNKKFFKINFSHKFPETINKKTNRKKLCTMIACNKMKYHPKELYSKRAETIQWFEKNHLEDFDLYGIGWDNYVYYGPKILKKILGKKILKKIFPHNFKSYKGTINRKADVLKEYKFTICYENVRDIEGWITEKIFDCFFAGNVPVYWGANNVAEHIPAECFIDRRNFQTHEDLYNYLKNMEDEKFLLYLDKIEDFLNSKEAYLFSTDYFSRIIIDEIITSLRLEKNDNND